MRMTLHGKSPCFAIRPTWEVEADTQQASATCWETARWDQVASGGGGMLVSVATIATRTSGP
ncbi:hypothetical protein GCM10009527_086950 [Actinomadura nitritigenes]